MSLIMSNNPDKAEERFKWINGITIPLKDRYQECCEEYKDKFLKKHGFDKNDAIWMHDIIGGFISVADYYIDMQVMVHSIDGRINKNKFFDWYDYMIEKGTDNKSFSAFDNYCKGIII